MNINNLVVINKAKKQAPLGVCLFGDLS